MKHVSDHLSVLFLIYKTVPLILDAKFKGDFLEHQSRVIINFEHPISSYQLCAPLELFQDGGRYHIETSPLIYRANQWTGFCIIAASVMKELIDIRLYKSFH